MNSPGKQNPSHVQSVVLDLGQAPQPVQQRSFEDIKAEHDAREAFVRHIVRDELKKRTLKGLLARSLRAIAEALE